MCLVVCTIVLVMHGHTNIKPEFSLQELFLVFSTYF